MESFKKVARENKVDLTYSLLYIDKINNSTSMSKKHYTEKEIKQWIVQNGNTIKFKHITILGFPNIMTASSDCVVIFKEGKL